MNLSKSVIDIIRRNNYFEKDFIIKLKQKRKVKVKVTRKSYISVKL